MLLFLCPQGVLENLALTNVSIDYGNVNSSICSLIFQYFLCPFLSFFGKKLSWIDFCLTKGITQLEIVGILRVVVVFRKG